jgi:hypothetical protein
MTPSARGAAPHESRTLMPDAATQIAAGETTVPDGTPFANPEQPQAVALLVLTWLIQAIRQHESNEAASG